MSTYAALELLVYRANGPSTAEATSWIEQKKTARKPSIDMAIISELAIGSDARV
jgi:hypothetical protein